MELFLGNSHRLMTVCPVTTVSNGPGPPQAKQITTLTCKKLPTTLNNQTTAKMVQLKKIIIIYKYCYKNTKFEYKNMISMF